MLESLKEEVFRANMRLVSEGLVVLTWGNASGRDPQTGLVAIKPSGVSYDELRASDIVIVAPDGKVVEGGLRPSSDTPTHLAIYAAFPEVGGIVHTHSSEAVAWAQARREIPCLGTTHADCFRGPVPLARMPDEREIAEDYEGNTGKSIVARFVGLDPLATPAVLVEGHGPFTWGKSPDKAVDAAVSLEAVAKMARLTWQVGAASASPVENLPQYVADKHFFRKHGPGAYYGQTQPNRR